LLLRVIRGSEGGGGWVAGGLQPQGSNGVMICFLSVFLLILFYLNKSSSFAGFLIRQK
jgi:hypothetical protein